MRETTDFSYVTLDTVNKNAFHWRRIVDLSIRNSPVILFLRFQLISKDFHLGNEVLINFKKFHVISRKIFALWKSRFQKISNDSMIANDLTMILQDLMK